MSRCECGYDPASATTGRPMMDETVELPPAPRSGAAATMTFGALLCVVGAYLTYTAYTSFVPLPMHDWRYVVGVCAVGVGLLRFRRGFSLADD